MPTKDTVIRALKRALWAMIMGAGSAFVALPVNLDEPKKYMVVLLMAVATGSLMGLQKLISGYVKYDLKK